MAPEEDDAHEPRPVIRARGLSRHFGDEVALADLDLDVEAGSIFGYVGASGSGKSTTIRLLTGILEPTRGEVEVLGRHPADFTPKQRGRIGYMPQLSVLYPQLSLWQNLQFVASLYAMPLRRRKRLREVLDFVELDGERRKRLTDASGGMQRRLALAAALIHSPELLFLDEPTAGIDPVLRRKLWDHFAALRDEGHTLFVTTQYVGEASFCDRVGVLFEGRLVAVDTPERLRRRAMGGDALDVEVADRYDMSRVEEAIGLDFVRSAERLEDAVRLTVDDAGTAIPRLNEWLGGRDLEVESIRQHSPSFDDVFVRLIEAEQDGAADADSEAAHA